MVREICRFISASQKRWLEGIKKGAGCKVGNWSCARAHKNCLEYRAFNAKQTVPQGLLESFSDHGHQKERSLRHRRRAEPGLHLRTGLLAVFSVGGVQRDDR